VLRRRLEESALLLESHGDMSLNASKRIEFLSALPVCAGRRLKFSRTPGVLKLYLSRAPVMKR
jgi:hypothetical protein